MTDSGEREKAGDTQTKQETQPSFFDGMENFIPHEKIDMSTLDKIKPLAPEYSTDCIEAIKKYTKE